ncbi:heat-inducible transcription repressor HrcA [Anoxybacter fermentans]|uniref:Heat-inducible transcription repressor HrcA n=1 Tax=Anoxybacter fermentans TaxID=1323375 RepID=A0A3Q9HQE7_9FIRM|nr:heat-inducible transcriptional repressor HrcA [Anoxybacter fermentans]AZR73176.1 heat-inducible transcription repressor HrcA [Anoxybacter fermentans]
MLDGRKWAILEAVIREYILTAEPIGSRTLTRRYNFGVSPATIRNEMADLEAMGYLEQPHASAGRIPSDKGYRIFVDALMKSNDLPSISEEVDQIFFTKKRQIHDLIQETTRMLSQLTHYISLGLVPNFEQTIFQHLQLIPLTSRKVVAVLVTDSGMVHNQIFSIPVTMSRKELGQISDFLNDRLQGMTLEEIDSVLMKKLERELVNRYDILSDVIKILYEELLEDVKKKLQQIFLDGTSYMIDQPEFADLKKLKTMMNMLEKRELLYNILNQSDNDETIQITIGQENPHKEMQDCSIISATYSVNGRPIGRIGILGPTRMEYGKVIAVVQYVANTLSKILSEKDE